MDDDDCLLIWSGWFVLPTNHILLMYLLYLQTNINTTSGGEYIRKGKKNSRVVEKLKNFDIQQKPRRGSAQVKRNVIND